LAALDPEHGSSGDDTASDGGFGGGGQDPMEEGMNRSASAGQVSLSLSPVSHPLSISLFKLCGMTSSIRRCYPVGGAGRPPPPQHAYLRPRAWQEEHDGGDGGEDAG
jgi:hypothetical protein